MGWIRRFAVPCLFGLSLVGPATGCASTSGGRDVHGWTMNTSPKLPTADGKVKVRVDAVGDHVVELTFQRLPAAERAFAGASMYMVWLVPRNAPPQPMGSLDVGEDLEAKVTIRTPNENFDVLVTAEGSADATTPSRNRAFDVAIRSGAA
ncbi:MAG TPA: hypothetical protein VHL80_05345 [Polyangia bacterium]|nr:hypothetical protein [Polyangia bacterium]